MLTKNHLAKVFVRRYQQCRFAIGRVEHCLIAYCRGRLSHIPYLMAVLAKAVDDRAVNTLIGDEFHVAVSAIG